MDMYINVILCNCIYYIIIYEVYIIYTYIIGLKLGKQDQSYEKGNSNQRLSSVVFFK